MLALECFLIFCTDISLKIDRSCIKKKKSAATSKVENEAKYDYASEEVGGGVGGGVKITPHEQWQVSHLWVQCRRLHRTT